MNRPALGVFPPSDWVESIENSFLKVKPKGLNQVFTAMCGSCANEIAFKAAFMYQQGKLRGENVNFTPQELSSCMNNQSPGSPVASILSFSSAFHGRMFASLSATRSKPIHKIDIPAMNWPKAPFPKLRNYFLSFSNTNTIYSKGYPLEEFQEENRQEESKCLNELESIIQEWSKKSPVAAVIVEYFLFLK